MKVEALDAGGYKTDFALFPNLLQQHFAPKTSMPMLLASNKSTIFVSMIFGMRRPLSSS